MNISRLFKCGIKAIFSLLFLTNTALADGMIIIEPPIFPPPVPTIDLAVKYHHVTVNIENQVAQVHIEQVFKNTNDYEVEGTYMFPIPEDAVLSDFGMWVDGEKLEAEVLEKDEAQRIYEEIVRRMIDPALLEYVGQGMFKARIYPIEANSEKKVEIDYTQVLTKDNDTIRFLYPLNTEKFSSEKLENVTVTVNIKGNEALKNIYSPTHNVAINKKGLKEASASYEENDVKPDRDFEVIYSESSNEFGMSVVSYKEPDENGFFLLLASPNIEIDEEDIAPKDVVFVLDTSGSMSGEKIEQAKDALLYCLNQLASQNSNGLKDRFNIIDFNDSVNKYKVALQNATDENIDEAKQYVESMEAAGGTNIHDSLLDALKMTESSESNKIIVFLTDGEPTVGITDEGGIVNAVKDTNPGNAKIFVFGVGNDVNTHLLDFISGDSKAISSYVSEDENIEVKVSSFFDKVSFPILSNLNISFSNDLAVYDLFPQILPDLYKGSQLVLFGRYRNAKASNVVLQGDAPNESIELSFEKTFPNDDQRYDYIPALWANRKVGYLMDQIRLHGDDSDELRESIIELSKKYGIINEYTSFLVEDDIPFYEPGFLEGAEEELDMNFGDMGFEMKTGGEAQRAVKNVQQMQQSENIAQSQYFLSEEQKSKIKQIQNKTFYEQDSKWVDSDYDGQETIKYSIGDDAYFELLTDNPEFGDYMALGYQVIFCSDGICHEIMIDATLWESYQNLQLFTDLPRDHWATDHVKKLVESYIIKGYEDRTFRPDQFVTRAEFLKMFLESQRLMEVPDEAELDFSDVEKNDWFYLYISKALALGFVSGYEDGTFRPNAPVTRAEAVKILLSQIAKTIQNFTDYDFTDIDDHWAKDFIQTAKNLGIIGGYEDGSFRPDTNITRAEASKIISSVLQGEDIPTQ